MKPLDDSHLPEPSAEAIEALELLVRVARIMPPHTEATFRKVLEQLALLGLKDEPTVRGMSSSVTQYAYAVASLTDHPEQEGPNVFATRHPGLLAAADVLEHRFKLRPTNARELLTRLEAEHRKDHP